MSIFIHFELVMCCLRACSVILWNNLIWKCIRFFFFSFLPCSVWVCAPACALGSFVLHHSLDCLLSVLFSAYLLSLLNSTQFLTRRIISSLGELVASTPFTPTKKIERKIKFHPCQTICGIVRLLGLCVRGRRVIFVSLSHCCSQSSVNTNDLLF